jgi:cob(I)alamin adenosyltransferase
MKIYTRTGDQGETSLFTGERVAKNGQVIEAIGTVDECNCSIGMALSFLGESLALLTLKEQLETIQHALFDVGAALATPRTKASHNKANKTRFDQEAIALLEQGIDAMDAVLPPLQAFILPGGDSCGAALHLARSICRRAERLVVPLYKQADVSEYVLIYLNRLSDYLFVASRYVNQMKHSPETIWKPQPRI